MGSVNQTNSLTSQADLRTDMIQSLMSIAFAFLDAGHIFITAIPALTSEEAKSIKTLAMPFEVDVIDIKENLDI